MWISSMAEQNIRTDEITEFSKFVVHKRLLLIWIENERTVIDPCTKKW